MEIEIKVQIEDKETLLKELDSNGEALYKDFQKDSYYTPSHRNFIEASPIKEWLRLRDSNGKYSINYKNWAIEADGTSNYCDEHESIIASFEEMEKIFSALNFKPLVVVEKSRSAWRYKEYEVSFDEVTDHGSFVEIEYKGATLTDPKEITDGMMKFLEQWNVGTIRRDFKGYPHLMLEKKNLL
ncbi:MAG: class IV adenylate cyclase [Candidatus Paceibacterota bacterium]